MSKKFDYLLKYIIVGDASVGKSNLLLRFVYNTFKSDYQTTIGVEFGEKNIKHNNKMYQLQLWDTAGQEQFRSITRAYFKNSVCALVVYDITNRSSFENVKQWIEDCTNYMPKNGYIVLVGNKCDLEEKREISKDEGQQLADLHGLLFFETSAKTEVNVNEVFTKSLEEIVKRINSDFYDLSDTNCGIKMLSNTRNNKLSNKKISNKKKKSCC
jgi:Ras-related protein Rab-2A